LVQSSGVGPLICPKSGSAPKPVLPQPLRRVPGFVTPQNPAALIFHKHGRTSMGSAAQPRGRACKAFCVLSEEGISIQMISSANIKTLVVIDEKYVELAVQPAQGRRAAPAHA
jgi:hypothetical protein